MARISTYSQDSNVIKEDKLIGSDSGGETKNFSLDSISSFFKNTNAAGVAGQLVYVYDTTVGQASGYLDSPSVASFETASARTFTISVFTFGNTSDTRADFIDTFLNKEILITNTHDPNNFGSFTVTNISTDGNFKTLTLSAPISGKGSFISGKAYAISVGAGGGSGDLTEIQTSTSNQLTITNGQGPVPSLAIVTGSIANAGTGLATADQIHTFVTTQTDNIAASTTGNAATATKIASITNSDIVQLTSSQTLTNKTIDLDNNTLSNIELDNLKSGVLDTDLSSVAGTDTTIASAKAIKSYVDSQVDTVDTLSEILANGNTTGATNIVVQKSIQLPTTTTNTGTPTDQGVISFGGTFTNSNRIFNDASGGTLRIQGSGNLDLFAPNHRIHNSNGNLIQAGDNGVFLYYQNSEKLATTSTGATVTGDILVTAGNITLGTDSVASNINAVGDVLVFTVDSNSNTSGTPNMQFKVGSSEKMRLTSTGNLGIGTTLPNRLLEVNSNASDVPQIRAAYNATNYLDLKHNLINAVSSGGNDSLQLQTAGTTGLTIDVSQNATFAGSITTTDTSGIIIDTTGNALLTIDGASGSTEAIIFKHSGTEVSRISHSNSTNLVFSTGSSVTTALTLDNSQNATFAGHISLSDSKKLKLGTGQDLEIYHDGSNSFIADTGTGGLYIKGSNFITIQSAGGENMIKAIADGAVELYHNNSKKFETSSDGVTITGSLSVVSNESFFYGGFLVTDTKIGKFGTGGDLQIFHNGSNSFITNFTGNLTITNEANDKDIVFKCDDGSGGFTEYLRLDGSATETVFSKDLRIIDSEKLIIGTDGDFQVFHNGSQTILSQQGTGNLIIQNTVNDADITFSSDDGSGGVTEYFRLDGSSVRTLFSQNTQHTDNVKGIFGNGDDLQIYHDGTNSNYITSTTSDIYLRNEGDNDRIFIQATNSGTIANYITVDGSVSLTKFHKNTKHTDNIKATFGDSSDLEIYHNGNDSVIDNLTGDFYISNKADDKDIIFRSDDGSGGFTEYLRLDGANSRTLFSKNLKLSDNVYLLVGSGHDLQLFHNSTNSFIINETGDLTLRNTADDKDIIFESDDGSGGTTAYFRLDGSDVMMKAHKKLRFLDSVEATFGNNDDLKISHNGTNTEFNNYNGGVNFVQHQADGDVRFYADGGSGSAAEYFRLDGGDVLVKYLKDLKLNDNVNLLIGSDTDLQLYHTGSLSYIRNNTGNLDIRNQTSGTSDIIFKTTTASGVQTFITLDGSLGYTTSSQHIQMTDGRAFYAGSGNDLGIFHNGTNTYLQNITGDLIIEQFADDKDIVFNSDDGSGGLTEYLKLDGGDTLIKASKNIKFHDDVQAWFGGANDLRIYHNGTNSNIENFTGTLQIIQNLDDGDIVFKSDNGGGDTTEYLRLDGGDARTIASREIRTLDGVAFKAGNSGDLAMFHDGSNSYIEESGTGDLFIKASNDIYLQAANNEFMAEFSENGSVDLYHNGSKKFETTSTGATITGNLVASNDITATGDLSVRNITATGGTSANATPLTIGSSSQTSYTLQQFKTSAHDTNNAYLIAYGSSHGSQAGNFAIKNTLSGKNIFFEVDGATRLTLDSSKATFANNISIPTGSHLFFDGGGNSTYISEDIADRLRFFVGGQEFMRFTESTSDTAGIFKPTTFSSDVTVEGNLTVNGTTTTLNTQTVEVEDNILQLNTTQGSPDTATASTSGISVYRGDGVTQASFIFDDADDTWDLSNNLVIENTSSTTNDSVSVLNLKSLSSGTTANGFGVGLGFFTENSTYSTVNELGRIEVVETSEVNLHDKMIFYVKHNNVLAERLNITGTDATFAGNINLADNKNLKLGAGQDLELFHNGTDSYIQSVTGHLNIINHSDDKDIIFKSDDGSGGTENYIQIDGSAGRTLFNKHIRVNDNVQVQVGSSADFLLSHNGTNTYASNYTGDLYIEQLQDDGDIIFKNDNGSGGTGVYMKIDGGSENVQFPKDVFLYDNVKLNIGGSFDLRLYHDTSNSYIQAQGTGNLIIQQTVDDSDIIFKSDDGSGGLAEYFKLDGSSVRNRFSKTVSLPDSVPLLLGNGDDLQIQHDGSNSYINEVGTGDLYIQTNGTNMFLRDNASGNTFIAMNTGTADVSLKQGGNTKLTTTSTGITVTGNISPSGVVVFNDNNGINFGNSDAKIYGSTANGIQFNGGGSEKMRLNQSGNLGINTTSPTEKLHISGGGSGNIRLDSGGTYYGTNVQAISSSGLKLGNDDFSGFMFFADDGTVGIGTNSPSQLLTIGDSSGNSFIDINKSTSGENGIIFNNAGNRKCAIIQNSGEHLEFHTNNNNVRMIMQEGGNVGIATTSPAAKLHVHGDVKIGGTTPAGAKIIGNKAVHIAENTFTSVLTVSMANHTSCYVKIFVAGDWSSHSGVAFLGEYFLQNGAGGYNEPGMIIREVDNTKTDSIVSKIVDPSGNSGNRDFVIQLKADDTIGSNAFSAKITYEVMGQFNSVT